MQTFVDVYTKQHGLAFLSRGLREYEVMDDDQRTLAITLLRGHRAYMTSVDNLSPEELERHIRGQHSLGEIEYEYALYPHKGDWRAGEVLREAYDHKVPMRVLQGVPKEGELPPAQSLIEIEPAGALQVSALCQSEDKKARILRVWNPTGEPQKARLRTILDVQRVKEVRMDETLEFGELEKKDGGWTFNVAAGRIMTLRME
jgi:mannosylglycerate hydrolase